MDPTLIIHCTSYFNQHKLKQRASSKEHLSNLHNALEHKIQQSFTNQSSDHWIFMQNWINTNHSQTSTSFVNISLPMLDNLNPLIIHWYYNFHKVKEGLFCCTDSAVKNIQVEINYNDIQVQVFNRGIVFLELLYIWFCSNFINNICVQIGKQ